MSYILTFCCNMSSIVVPYAYVANLIGRLELYHLSIGAYKRDFFNA